MTAGSPQGGRSAALLELTRTRLLEFVRIPEAVFWVFVFPVLLAVALGIAFRAAPPQAARVAVTGQGAAAAAVAADLEKAGLAPRPLGEREAAEALRTGKVELVVEVAGQRERPAHGERPARVGYVYDAARPESREARLSVDAVLQDAAGRDDPLSVTESVLTEPGSRYIDFLIPGLIGLNLMGSGMWGIGFTVVEARSRKLLKRLAASPMRRSDYLLSLALSRLAFLVVELAALVAFGWIAFDVAVRGSLLDLAVVSLAGAASFSGLALLVAARTRTVEAASGWMNLIMLPMWVLSGSFFSYSRFPEIAQPAIRLLPLTALNDALRLVINDGAPLAAAGVEMLVLAAWMAVGFALALRWFRWQ